MQTDKAIARAPSQGKTPPVATVNVRELVRDPLGFFLTLTREYGDIVQYRATVEPAYLINRPGYIKHVLQKNGRNYNKDTYLNKHQLRALTGNGILTSEKPFWRTQRRLIQPAFHRRSLGKFTTIMRDATAAVLHRWAPHAAQQQPIDVAEEMMQFTLDVVTQSLFGYDGRADAETVGKAMNTIIATGKTRHRKFKESLAVLDAIVYKIIDQRRRQPEREQDDLLAMLLQARYEDGQGMSDQQLRDEIMTLFVAGHETTANTLSWLWYLLAQHEDVFAQLREEAATVLNGRIPTLADFAHLPYTKMVIEESMRLYPSAWSISRRALADDQIGGYHIPARAIVAISPYTIHRHPRYWQEPEKFDPARFTPERAAARPRFAYLPFGGGERRCIGEHFAMMESMMLVTAVVQTYRLHLDPHHPVVPHALATLRPRHGILATLEPLH